MLLAAPVPPAPTKSVGATANMTFATFAPDAPPKPLPRNKKVPRSVRLSESAVRRVPGFPELTLTVTVLNPAPINRADRLGLRHASARPSEVQQPAAQMHRGTVADAVRRT